MASISLAESADCMSNGRSRLRKLDSHMRNDRSLIDIVPSNQDERRASSRHNLQQDYKCRRPDSTLYLYDRSVNDQTVDVAAYENRVGPPALPLNKTLACVLPPLLLLLRIGTILNMNPFISYCTRRMFLLFILG